MREVLYTFIYFSKASVCSRTQLEVANVLADPSFQIQDMHNTSLQGSVIFYETYIVSC